MFNLDNNMTNSDWVKQSWDVGVDTLEGYLGANGLVNADVEAQKAAVKHFTELPAYAAAPDNFKHEVDLFLNSASKAIRPELKRPPSQGVPSALEVARALSRLDILPNAPDPTLEDPTKYVESPWTIVNTFTVNPNLWDDAVLAVVNLDDLVATDPFLNRKKVAKRIEAMGQAITPNRHYALVVVRDGQYTIIDGHHRLMAQWLLGQATAAAWVVTLKGSN